MTSEQILLRSTIMEDLRKLQGSVVTMPQLQLKGSTEYYVTSVVAWDEVISSLPVRNVWMERIGSQVRLFNNYSSRYGITINLILA